jgi:hypothetical protein
MTLAVCVLVKSKKEEATEENINKNAGQNSLLVWVLFGPLQPPE